MHSSAGLASASNVSKSRSAIGSSSASSCVSLLTGTYARSMNCARISLRVLCETCRGAGIVTVSSEAPSKASMYSLCDKLVMWSKTNGVNLWALRIATSSLSRPLIAAVPAHSLKGGKALIFFCASTKSLRGTSATPGIVMIGSFIRARYSSLDRSRICS